MPSISLGKNLWYPWDVLQLDALGKFPPNITYGDAGDGACAPHSWPVINISMPFVDALRIPNLDWKRTKTLHIGGRSCQLYQTAKLPSAMPAMSGPVSICVAEDGAPLLFAQGWFTSCTISNVTVGPPPEEAFRPSQACRSYPSPPCPNSSGVVDLTLYRLHTGAEPLELDNRDLGDDLGAPSIICDWPTTGQSYVTSFAVTVNSTWGQYGRCHFNGTNYCDAQTGDLVGRQSPQGLPGVPGQGQCTDNTYRGNWYSFPASGKCRPGEPVGSRGCTWSARVLRTVKASCIENWAFRAACMSEIGHTVHQAKAAAIIKRALASGNIFAGGCPAVRPHEPAEMVEVVV